MAIRRSGRPTANPRPLCPTTGLCGTAVTVPPQPGDKWMLHVATRQLEPRLVLGRHVVVVAWSTECAGRFFRELLATVDARRDRIGLVLDRCRRYGAAPERMNFRVFARRSTPWVVVPAACAMSPKRPAASWMGQHLRPPA